MTTRAFPSISLCLIVLALAAACGSTPPSSGDGTLATDPTSATNRTVATAREGAGSAPRVDRRTAARSLAELVPAPGEAQWKEGARAGATRVALVVAVDTYAESNWNLPDALTAGRRVEAVLTEELHFDAVELLNGEAAYGANVENKVRLLTEGMTGPDNLILVHWVGHGHEMQGRMEMLTAQSAIGGSKGHTNTLPYDALTNWLGDAKRSVSSQGGGLTTALVMDACRLNTMSAPRRIRDHVPSVDVEAFSAGFGLPADGPDYSLALARALSSSSGAQVRLLDALQKARDQVSRQEPEIKTGDADAVLLDRTNLAVSVQALDARDGFVIPGAFAELNRVERPMPAEFTGLAESPEGYALQVWADGYFRRSLSVRLDPQRSGQQIQVGLSPSFVALTGRIDLADPGIITVTVEGAFPRAIDGYHETSTTLDRSGNFYLRVPRTVGPRTLLMNVNGVEQKRIDFDMATRPSEIVKHHGVSVELFDFGGHVLDASGSRVAVGGGVQEETIGEISVEFEWSALAESDFADRRGWQFYSTIRTYAEAGQYDVASYDLQALKSDVDPSRLALLEELGHELEVAELSAEASRLQSEGDLESAIAVLMESEQRSDRRLRAMLVNWHQVAARDRLGQDDHQAALELLEQALELEPEDVSLLSQSASCREAWMQSAVDAALADGDWVAARDVLAATYPPGVEGGAAWSTRIEQESISRVCRQRYQMAVELASGRQLEEAWEQFGLAAEEGCNEHYRTKIEAQRQALGDELFVTFDAVSAEHFARGELVEAFTASRRAIDFYPLVFTRLDHLADDVHPQEPELVEQTFHDLALQLEGDKAARSARRYAELIESRGADPRDRALAQDLLGHSLRPDVNDESGTWRQAAVHFAKAAELWEAAGDEAAAGRSLFSQASSVQPDRHPAGSWATAAFLYGRAAELARQGGDLATQGESLLEQATCLRPDHNADGSWSEAAVVYADVASFNEEIGQPIAQARSLRERAFCLRPDNDPRGSWEQAVALYETSARLFGEQGDLEGQAESLRGQAFCLQPDKNPAGSWDASVELYVAAASLGAGSGGRGRGLHEQARCMEPGNHPDGSWSTAASYYEQAATASAAAGDVTGQVESLLGQARCLAQQVGPGTGSDDARFTALAYDLAGQAAGAARSAGDPVLEGRCLLAQSDYRRPTDSPLKLLAEAESLFARAGDTAGQAQVLFKQAAYEGRKDRGRAAQTYARAARVFAEAGDPVEQGRALLAQARVTVPRSQHLSTRNIPAWKEAAQLCAEAADLFEAAGAEADLAQALVQQALCEIRQHRADMTSATRELLQRAQQISERIGDEETRRQADSWLR